MNTRHLLIAFACTAGTSWAQAHEFDSREKIQVACAQDPLYMGAIARAVNRSGLWASQGARRQMLSLARQSCERGARIVTFVPAAEERSCQMPPKWSTLCLDPAAMK